MYHYTNVGKIKFRYSKQIEEKDDCGTSNTKLQLNVCVTEIIHYFIQGDGKMALCITTNVMR